MSFGWAYIDCSGSGGGGGSGGQAAGPTGSIQFLTGANATNGSNSLLYYTASYGSYAASTLVMSGTLIVSGTISASAYVVHQTDTISGSTIFGNSADDTHIRTGSLYVGDSSATVLTVSLPMSQSKTMGFRVSYTPVTTSTYTASSSDYILGVRQTGDVDLRLPVAATVDSGTLIVVKDELLSRGSNSIYISASLAIGETVDGDSYYELTGTMPAISLYSNGTDWLVF